MKNYLHLLGLICLLSFQAQAQMQGAEETIEVIQYQGDFVVNGDKDTYYPVIFKNGNQNKINHLKIYRGYNWAGPAEFSPTHKGGLLLEFNVNYGGWGGIRYGWRIEDLQQQYHETFANAAFGMHKKGFIVWLRGGGFLYRYESDKKANLQVAYDTSTKIYDHSNDNYDVYAPAAISTPDDENIESHTNGHWKAIKGINNDLTSTGTLQLTGNKNHYIQNGRLGIGTNNPQSALSVNGNVTAKEVQVKATGWSDFVFEEDYDLPSLERVADYIKENQHLPDIPSEKEVMAQGISLGEMDSKLLQKIEELTLYLIAMEKERKAANTEVQSLKNEIKTNNAEIRTLMDELKSLKER